MAYPEKINALVDIAGTSTLAAVGHAARHNDLNDAFDELAVVLTVPAANTLALAPGGTERLRVTSAGNVGIGTSSPAKLLDVNGDALVSGLTVGKGGGAQGANTAVGFSALAANTTGGSNTAFGHNSMPATTTGQENTAVGQATLNANTTGSNNTALGRFALLSNTTASSNTGLGYGALQANTTGFSNTAVGLASLDVNTTGANNTAVGAYALHSNTTGGTNTAIGLQAGWGTGTNSNTTGNNNTFIGNESAGASATANNVITLGNGAITTLRCNVTTITALSDARDKANVEPIPAGLDFVNRLSPVAFDWDTRDGAKVGVADMGFIAQDLLQVMEDTGITVPNLVSQENPDRLEAGYGTLIPVLVQAIKELSAQVRQLQEAANA